MHRFGFVFPTSPPVCLRFNKSADMFRSSWGARTDVYLRFHGAEDFDQFIVGPWSFCCWPTLDSVIVTKFNLIMIFKRGEWNNRITTTKEEFHPLRGGQGRRLLKRVFPCVSYLPDRHLIRPHRSVREVNTEHKVEEFDNNPTRV